MSELTLEDIKEILRDCPEYEPGHHMHRPFMSAYQIAIKYAERHPEYLEKHGLSIGGAGTGEYKSLAQKLAGFLSSELKKKGEVLVGIEGGFISHKGLAEMSFKGPAGDSIGVSTLGSEKGHAIFRIRE